PLERTSVQLPRQTIELLDSWPSLNRSEALRIVIGRYHYLEAIAAPQAERLVEKYRPVFHVALEDLSFAEYKAVVRSLPEMVMEAMREESTRERVENARRRSGQPAIDWQELKSDLGSLDQVGRLRVLDYVVGQRLEGD